MQQHLDYLKDLGVTTVWLTPVVKNGAAQDYHGYGATDLYAVEPHPGLAGGLPGTGAGRRISSTWQSFVRRGAESRGTAASPGRRMPPMPDWFHGTTEHHLTAASPLKGPFYGQPDKKEITNDVFESLVDPHTPPQLRRNLTEGWFFGVLPDMNTEKSGGGAMHLEQNNGIWWAETTAGTWTATGSTPFPYVFSREFWEQWHTALRRIYPRLSTIGEVFHPDPTVTSFYQGGRKGWDGIDTQLTAPFDFPFYFALRDVLLNGAQVGKLANILRRDSLYPHPEFLVPFFGNHDTTRFAGTPEEGTCARLKLAFGLIFTVRGIPEMYYGDGIGMPGGRDPDNRRDFPAVDGRKIRRTAFTKNPGALLSRREIHEYVSGSAGGEDANHLPRCGEEANCGASHSDDTTFVFMRETDEERASWWRSTRAKAPRGDCGAAARILRIRKPQGAAAIFGLGQATVEGKTLRLRVPGQSVSVFLLQ